MKPWFIPAVPVVALVLACDAKPPAQSSSEDIAPRSGAAPAQAEPSPPAQAPSQTPSQPGGEDWIVWFDAGDGVRSRWYNAVGQTATMLAERKALAVSDGEQLWHVRRADSSKTVMACACIEDESSSHCAEVGTVVTPGLEAQPMGDAAPVILEVADTETTYGEVDALSLALHGGVGTRLFVETADSGYYCGAHGSYASQTRLRDVSVQKQPERWPAMKLPDVMLRQAALSEEMFESYQECWGQRDVGLDAFVRDEMRIASVSLSLDRGMPKLRWNTEADGPYVCTGDYAFDGYVDTGLMPAAEPLGLGAPVPAPLAAALKDVGTAKVVGWSAVRRDGPAREAALTWFGGLDETPWPPATSQQVSAPAVSDQTRAKQRTLLAKGRTLTRSKDYPGAIAALTEAIEADPKAARPHGARCYAQLLGGDTAKARGDCERALKLEEDSGFRASVHYNLGQISEKEGKLERARASYRTSLKLRPNATVQAALDALEDKAG